MTSSPMLRRLALAASALAVAALPAAAAAKPDRPVDAAETSSGAGCLVRDGAGAYHYDAACKWNLVVKRDKDGNVLFFSYQDKGKVPEGAPLPSSAQRSSGPWPSCGANINEVTTPSGQYSSDCRYRR